MAGGGIQWFLTSFPTQINQSGIRQQGPNPGKTQHRLPPTVRDQCLVLSLLRDPHSQPLLSGDPTRIRTSRVQLLLLQFPAGSQAKGLPGHFLGHFLLIPTQISPFLHSHLLPKSTAAIPHTLLGSRMGPNAQAHPFFQAANRTAFVTIQEFFSFFF